MQNVKFAKWEFSTFQLQGDDMIIQTFDYCEPLIRISGHTLLAQYLYDKYKCI